MHTNTLTELCSIKRKNSKLENKQQHTFYEIVFLILIFKRLNLWRPFRFVTVSEGFTSSITGVQSFVSFMFPNTKDDQLNITRRDFRIAWLDSFIDRKRLLAI